MLALESLSKCLDKMDGSHARAQIFFETCHQDSYARPIVIVASFQDEWMTRIHNISRRYR